MWKIRASTLIRQTLRAELCVIYPLLALWNKFSLFHWNLKEGTENKSSLGVSWLTRGGQRVKGQNQLTPSCECVSAHPLPPHTHTYTPTHIHSSQHSQPPHTQFLMMIQNKYFLAIINWFISSLKFSSEEILKHPIIYSGSAYLCEMRERNPGGYTTLPKGLVFLF